MMKVIPSVPIHRDKLKNPYRENRTNKAFNPKTDTESGTVDRLAKLIRDSKGWIGVFNEQSKYVKLTVDMSTGDIIRIESKKVFKPYTGRNTPSVDITWETLKSGIDIYV